VANDELASALWQFCVATPQPISRVCHVHLL
jgi:hypothetical protein